MLTPSSPQSCVELKNICSDYPPVWFVLSAPCFSGHSSVMMKQDEAPVAMANTLAGTFCVPEL